MIQPVQVGCILYELAARRRPFGGSGDNPVVINKNILRCEPKPISSAYSSEFRAMVGTLLTREMCDRASMEVSTEALLTHS